MIVLFILLRKDLGGCATAPPILRFFSWFQGVPTGHEMLWLIAFLWITALVFIGSKMIDEILEHGQLLDRQVFELHPTAPDADLLPGTFRDFPIIYNFALNIVHVNEKIIAAEYFYCGALIIILTCRQVPEAHSSHADILDLPSIDMLIWS